MDSVALQALPTVCSPYDYPAALCRISHFSRNRADLRNMRSGPRRAPTRKLILGTGQSLPRTAIYTFPASFHPRGRGSFLHPWRRKSALIFRHPSAQPHFEKMMILIFYRPRCILNESIRSHHRFRPLNSSNPASGYLSW